ncbi:MAG: hypothetical protein U5R31_05660 [Acidimicrobiia bacterium]|nr:hypothetical protein [Acidimicrobiia bacterium]
MDLAPAEIYATLLDEGRYVASISNDVPRASPPPRLRRCRAANGGRDPPGPHAP